MKTPKQPRKTNKMAVDNMARTIDLLAEFDELIPALRKLVREKATAEKIYTEMSSICAARGVNIALTERDSSKALAAIRDVLDRSQGKAKERAEVTHRLEKLPDQEIDAVLLTGLSEIDEMEKGPRH